MNNNKKSYVFQQQQNSRNTLVENIAEQTTRFAQTILLLAIFS